MKNSNYLVGLAALALVGCSDNDFLGTTTGPEGIQQGNGEITFGASSAKQTRADMFGTTAAEKLGNTFVVEGTKGQLETNSPSLTPVFDNYVVMFDANTAGTTESNTNNWEYVGKSHAAIGTDAATQIGRTVNEQTIKYWDYSTEQYDFIAYSTGNSTMVAGTDKDAEDELSDGEVSVTKIATGSGLSTNAYRFIGKSVADLSQCYITDITPVLKEKYNNVVTLKFKNITSKVRVGLYETVPGYSIKNVQFYNVEGAAAPTDLGTTGVSPTATLFVPSGSTIPQSGTITVRYPHIGSANESEQDYNIASVSVTPGASSATYLGFGALTSNYGTAERNEAAGSIYLGRTLPQATFAGLSSANYYTPVLPNTSGQNLTLRVNYTLVSTDGSGEEINVYGAKAVVPSTYTTWLNNYAYTYIFKISDNTNGWTSTIGTDPAGLFPITFDAVVKEMVESDGEQTTVTTVATPSITTYQQNHVYTTNEYAKSTEKDIYVQVMNNKVSPATLVTDLNGDVNTAAGTDVQRGQLYLLSKATATEADVMEALLRQKSEVSNVITGRNSLTLTKSAAIDNTVTSIVNDVKDDEITSVIAGTASKITIADLTAGKSYAYVYDYSTATKNVVKQYQQVAVAVGTTSVTGYYALSSMPTTPETSGTASAEYIYLSKTYNGTGAATWAQVTVVNGKTDVTGLYKVAKSTLTSAAGTAAAETLYFDVYDENDGQYAVKVIKIVADAATASLTASANAVTAPDGTSIITYRENGKVVTGVSVTSILKKAKTTDNFDTWTGAAPATDAQATCVNNNDGTYTFTGKEAGIYRVTIGGQTIDITVTVAP